MAIKVSPQERRNCWITMSELFVDNEVDYRYIAYSLTVSCPNMPLPLLKTAFFHEVAPALATNGMTPAPEVWTGFDSDAVVRNIGEMLVRRQTSFFFNLGNHAWCLICRWLCNEMWQKLEREIVALGHPAG